MKGSKAARNTLPRVLLATGQYQDCLRVFFTSQPQLRALCFSKKKCWSQGRLWAASLFPEGGFFLLPLLLRSLVPAPHGSPHFSAEPALRRYGRQAFKESVFVLPLPGPTSCFRKNSFYPEKRGEANQWFFVPGRRSSSPPYPLCLVLGRTLTFSPQLRAGDEPSRALGPGPAGPSLRLPSRSPGERQPAGRRLPWGAVPAQPGPLPRPGAGRALEGAGAAAAALPAPAEPPPPLGPGPGPRGGGAAPGLAPGHRATSGSSLSELAARFRLGLALLFGRGSGPAAPPACFGPSRLQLPGPGYLQGRGRTGAAGEEEEEGGPACGQKKPEGAQTEPGLPNERFWKAASIQAPRKARGYRREVVWNAAGL